MTRPVNPVRDILRDLNVTRVGVGLPMVTLHGGLGFDHTSFRPALDPLADVNQLVYFDHRGNGNAVAPADWSTVTHDTFVDDLEALREALGTEQMVLLGHSYGGFLALEYATRFPRRVAGLVLCTTGPSYRHFDRIVANVQQRATPQAFDAIMRWLASPSATDAALAADIAPLLPLYLHAPTPELMDAVFGNVTFRADAFNRALSTLAPAYDVSAALSTLAMPTLVIAGDDDPIFPLDCGPALLAERMPNAELIVMEACGHYPFAERPDRFVSLVREWLGRLPRTRHNEPAPTSARPDSSACTTPDGSNPPPSRSHAD